MPTIPTPDARTLAEWEAKGLIPRTTQRQGDDLGPKREKGGGGKKSRQKRFNAKSGSISEAAFQRQVIEYAALNGWEVYHVPDSRRVTACGFPDLVMMHPTRSNPLIAAELKRDGQKPRADQVAWMTAFRLAGVPCYLWVPSGWDEVAAVLSGTTQQG